MSIITTELEQEKAYAKVEAHNLLPTVVNNPIKRSFYISCGRKTRMFTLWREPIITNGQINPFAKEQYICNLSTNLEKAVDKALSQIGKFGHVYIEQDEIFEKGDNFKFETGKHAGKFIADVVTEDPEFLLFMCKLIWKNQTPNRYGLSRKQKNILSYETEALALVAEIDAKKEVVGKHLGEIKGKLSLEVTMHAHRSWGTSWSGEPQFNTTFKDTEGNTLIYIGTVDCEKFAKVGDLCNLSCTVKAHAKWKNYLQTKILRPIITVKNK